MLRWKISSDDARAQALEFYEKEVDPLLTPVTIDPSHPFPRVLNKALCLALLLRHKRRANDGHEQTAADAGRGDGSARAAAADLPAAKRRSDRDFILLHDLIESQVRADVPRVRGAVALGVSRDAQQQSVYAGGRVAVGAGERARGAAQPAQGRCGAAGDRELARAKRSWSGCARTSSWTRGRCFETDGPVNLSRLMNLYSEVEAAGAEVSGLRRRRSSSCGAKSVDLFDELRTTRCPAAPSVRLVQDGGGLHRGRREGSRR